MTGDKKMLKRILLALSLMSVSLHSFAESNVEVKGAFGLKFGEIAQNINKAEINKGWVRINPPTPIPEYFSSYSVMVDKDNDKIYAISGSKQYKTREECYKYSDNLSNVFAQAYGKENVLKRNDGYTTLIEAKNSIVMLRCIGNGMLVNSYINIPMMQSSFEE